MTTSKALLKEITRRQRKKQLDAQKPQFIFDNFCFPAQRAFFRGEGSRFRNAVCSRRAGKTVGIAADAIDTVLDPSGGSCLYVTLTRQTARTIIWNDLKKIIEDYELNFKVNEALLEATCLDTGFKVHIAGAKDATEIEKFRGWKLKKIYLDEAQSFRSYIKYFVDDILIPCLRDLRGSLYVTGTPGPIKAGYFYTISQSTEWNAHAWTAFDNPHMHNPPELDLEETLFEERKIKGIDETDPGYIRETYGKWMEDTDSLVFKFSREYNIFSELPERQYHYVFGVDLGFEDSDAIAVLAFDEYNKDVFLVEEIIRNKQNITDLVNEIRRLQKKYNPIKMVLDAGALGKKIQEEIRTRHALTLEAAEKTRKAEFIELLNDDMRTSKFKAFPGSMFEEDCFLVQWDRESKNRNPESPQISRAYHSDICDAVLYAWRECKHYISQPQVHKPRPDQPGYMEYLEQKEMEAFEAKKQPDWGGPSQADMDSLLDDY